VAAVPEPATSGLLVLAAVAAAAAIKRRSWPYRSRGYASRRR